jgi:hypothetical protein
VELFELVRTYSHSSKVGKSGKIIFGGPFVSIRPLLSLLSLYVFFVSFSCPHHPGPGISNRLLVWRMVPIIGVPCGPPLATNAFGFAAPLGLLTSNV